MTASTRRGTLDLSPNAITVLERRYLLDRLPLVILHQVAPLEHGDGVGTQIERPSRGGSGHPGSSLTE